MSNAVKLLTVILLLGSAQGAYASDFLPYEAIYKTKLNGFNVKIKRRVEVKGSQISVSNDAKKFWFRFHESSLLADNDDGVLLPVTHDHKRTGVSKKHDKELVFNWTDSTVLDSLKPKSAPLSIDRPTYDKLSYQTQMRLDLMRDPELQHLEYSVTNGIRNRIYSLDRVGEEIVNTPLGKLRTYKWERTGDDDDRQVLVWVAPDWDFLLVRIDQTKLPDGETERLILQSAEIAGKPVQGL
jgi:hypothetical protein